VAAAIGRARLSDERPSVSGTEREIATAQVTAARGAAATYYTVSDRNYFLGTVTLSNSLRLTGNGGSLVVLDAGLSHGQRHLLMDYATVVDLPEGVSHPFLVKPYPHFLDPEGPIVIIDSDVIVTGSLAEIIERAERGAICAYPDHPDTRARWFPEWQSRLGLRSPLRRDVCVNSGFIAFAVDHWPGLLGRWWEVCQRVRPDEISVPGPFQAPDQDALNALLMSELPRERLHVLPESEAGFGVDVGMTISVRDFDTLRCTSGEHEIRILHFLDRPKPWERAGWARLAAADYIRLMRRLLFAPDVALRIDPADVPLWLRPGRDGEVVLRTLGALNRGIVSAARRMPEPVRERLRRVRRAMTSRRPRDR
jgi:hypothetical protein